MNTSTDNNAHFIRTFYRVSVCVSCLYGDISCSVFGLVSLKNSLIFSTSRIENRLSI